VPHPRLVTELSTRLGLDWPLIQAPLGGGPSTPELVAAASNAGVLGSLGAAYMSPFDLENAINAIRQLTSRPFGVNLFAPAPEPQLSTAQIEAALDATRPYRNDLDLPDPAVKPPFHENFANQFAVILNLKPAVFSFTFGLLDKSAIDDCRRHGIITMGTANSVDEGLALQQSGVDAVVAQGAEAGGHRGQFSVEMAGDLIGTFALTRAMVSALRIPVIASGGIMDGSGIAAALTLGAQAAHLGTAFLLCDEAGTSPAYRKALQSAHSGDTRLTRAFSGRWARGLENRFMREMAQHDSAVLPYPAQNAFTRDIRKKATQLGSTDYLSLWAGQGVGLIRQMKAAELVQSLLNETLAALRLYNKTQIRRTRYRISLEGVVQGVGFRPFVSRLADRHQLPGIAFNTAGGLVVEVETDREAEFLRFLEAIQREAPPAARIENCVSEELPDLAGYIDFRIVSSAVRDHSFTLISPDLATCQACLEEIGNPAERRFRYPFTNCTNCGPRYTITLSTPYDRANTTMQHFPLCAACAAEYADPANRRFHAEPVACSACGPRLSFELAEATDALKRGEILAIKGLGGFQLACDAFRADTVDSLRLRKRRSRKPFAVMMRDIATAERYCQIGPGERAALQSSAAPIVLLQLTSPGQIPDAVAPGLNYLGVMLPYTPLHHLLFGDSLSCLVMTSGNISEEPIVIDNAEAIEKLSSLADQVVTHNRDIFMRVDDSVVRLFEGTPRVLRRARGFAPGAIRLAHEVGEVLAVGPELKNTFCLTKGRYAVMSQHIGDMENLETLKFFEETLRNLESVYQIKPRVIAHDLHPNYMTTRWALGRPEPKIAVQHHHAHIASCMAENGVNDPVIGVAFDGTGFGTDGQIWGGEFLLCDYRGFERCAHLRYASLPGGDRAARQGWRMAASHLRDALGPDYRQLDLPCWNAAASSTSAATWSVIDKLIARPQILTSSCGRLFDAVSAICGISFESNYEGESAMLLEAAAAEPGDGIYEFDVNPETTPWTIDTRPLLKELAHEVSSGCPPNTVARKFHNSVARMISAVCHKLRERNGVNRVCLSGGTFQNHTLLKSSSSLLRADGFEVFLHAQVPPNDGGISLGQAVIAAAQS